MAPALLRMHFRDFPGSRVEGQVLLARILRLGFHELEKSGT